MIFLGRGGGGRLTEGSFFVMLNEVKHPFRWTECGRERDSSLGSE